MFQVQADIAGRVARGAGRGAGRAAAAALAERPTENLAAYDAFLKGEEAVRGIGDRRPRERSRRAIGYYEQAVALDSDFALAWAQLSRAHSLHLQHRHAHARQTTRGAPRAAERALALAPDRPEGHLALGDYQQLVRRDDGGGARGVRGGPAKAPDQRRPATAPALVEQSLGPLGGVR